MGHGLANLQLATPSPNMTADLLEMAMERERERERGRVGHYLESYNFNRIRSTYLTRKGS